MSSVVERLCAVEQALGLPGARASADVASGAEVAKLEARVAELEKVTERQAYRIKILVKALDRSTGADAAAASTDK